MNFNPINPPFGWEEAWTKYPHGYTIYEALLDWLKHVNDLTTNVNDWNTYLEGFVETFDDKLKDEVVAYLNVWQENGYLEIIIEQSLSAKLEKTRLYHLDDYTSFFNVAGAWFVTGQRTTTTTTTSEVASGSVVLPLASVTDVLVGMTLLIKPGTAHQQVLKVQSIVSNNVTVTPALATTLENGSTVSPLWLNASHLTTLGVTAWVYYLITRKDIFNNFIIPRTGSPRITFFGNSWMSQLQSTINAVVLAEIPSAIIQHASVTGNTSALLVSRLNEIPTDSEYVFFNEPGVNDVSASTSLSVMIQNLTQIFYHIRSISAVPIYTGFAPLSDFKGASKLRATQFKRWIGAGFWFPALDIASSFNLTEPENNSIGLGLNALLNIDSGTRNTAFGTNTLRNLTTGTYNTSIGTSSGSKLETGDNNTAYGAGSLENSVSANKSTALGTNALFSKTTGDGSTAVGALAGFLATTGRDNVFIGNEAAWRTNGVTTGATTVGEFQTIVGAQAMGSPTQHYATALGYRALALAAYATALGSGASAGHTGAVAIGQDSGGASASTSQNNEFVLGTANHKVKVKGTFGIAQGTPTGSADARGEIGDILVSNTYIFVKTSSGWKRTAILETF